jgi:OTU domain-containing protein 3
VTCVQSDGNCLFRAIADQIDGDESLHMKYRVLSVEHMRKNPDFFKPFVETEELRFEEYLDEMEGEGCYADTAEIIALSEFLPNSIEVY